MFYHACLKCSAKFFAPEQSLGCPRCGGLTLSEKKDSVPWANIRTAKELEQERSKQLEDEEMRKRYAEQQARRSCPGCGESPFLG